MLGFSTEKTIQATSHLLKREPGHRSNYMRILKLLYLAERRSLELRATPLCGDTPFAMENGPVLSTTLNLIKGVDPASTTWGKFIKLRKFDIEMTVDPGNLKLSRSELRILDEVSEKFADLDEWELVKWCHDNLPEFKENDPAGTGKKRNPIPLASVLKCVGRDGEAERIQARVNENLAFSAFYRDHSPTLTQ